MVFVRYPFPGFQLKPQLRHLLPRCEGRPRNYSLSILYSCPEIDGYDEEKAALYETDEPNAPPKRYPGAHPLF